MSEVKKMKKSVASFSQKRIWFLDAFDPNNSAYNVVYFWQTQGRISPKVLQNSINYLINRHPSLRTYFSSAAGELQQCIHEAFSVIVEEMECAEAELEMLSFARQVFDLKKLPLFSVCVFRDNNQANIIGFNFHHIICDGWSLGVFFKELSEVYKSYSLNQEPNLANISKDYSDYSAQEAESMGSIETEAIDYWGSYLKDVPQLNIPTDYLRPALQTFEGQREIVFLEKDYSDSLKLKARESNSSLYMVLLSAYLLVMKIYSGQNDIVVGTPVANRVDIDFSDTFGLFVNSVVVRCDVDSNKINTFEDLLNLVKNDFLNTLEYQSYPFEKVVEHISPERALSHNPLFQIMFVLQDGNGSNSLIINDQEAVSIDGKLGSTRFDIECTTWDKPDGIKIRLNYNSSLYNATTIQSMLHCYVEILKKIASSRMSELNINLLPGLQFPDSCMSRLVGNKMQLPDSTIPSMIFDDDSRIDGVAVSCGEESVNYNEFKDKTGSIASYISKLINNDQGGKVVVILQPSIEMAIIIAAILRTNITLIPINPNDPDKRRDSILALTDPDLVISNGMQFNDFKNTSPLELFAQASADGKVINSFIRSKLDTIAYVIHTSGTTGEPKGVQISHAQLLNTVFGAAQFIKLGHGDILPCWSSCSFDIFYLEFLLPLWVGAELKLVTNHELFSPEIIISILEKVSCIVAVPGLLHQLLDNILSEKKALDNIKYALVGGDLVPPALFEKMSSVFPNAQNFILYGPTETTIICTNHPYNKHSHDRYIIGRPMMNVEVRICDSNNNILPRGAVGEIIIGGRGVSSGYLLDSKLTAEKFIRLDGERFYKTGDKGKLAFDDCIEFHGRDDSQVKLRGFRINLNEISSAINNHPSIDKAVTVLHKKNEQQQYIVSYATPKISEYSDYSSLLNTWEQLFDNTHKEHKQVNIFDFSGWESSIDGKPLTQDIMHDWLSSTAEAILEEVDQGAKNNKELRVLEIGCGSGLILFKIIEYCSKYIGTDISSEVLQSLDSKIELQVNNVVSLVHCSAEKTLQHVSGEFDLIILNSICQYFPNQKYFEQVFKDLHSLLSDRGVIFVGDVRSLHLSKYFYKQIADFQVKIGQLEAEEVDSFISAKEFFDNELLMSPRLFNNVSSNLGLKCFISPKLDCYDSEMSAFRYNAVLKHTTAEKEVNELRFCWKGFEHFQQMCVMHSNSNKTIIFIDVPNNRIHIDNVEWTPSIREIIEFAASIGLQSKFSWASANSSGKFDVIIAKDFSLDQHYNQMDIGEIKEKLCSDPSAKMYLRILERELLDYLGNILPRYMVPRQIEFVNNIPLGANNKVSSSKLPSPRLLKYDLEYMAPENYLQKAICQSWSEILGVHRIGINDNFFKLGGTSLLAIQAAIQLRKKGLNLRPQVLFKHQTAKELAGFINKEQAGNLITACMVSSDRDNKQFSKTYHVSKANKLDLSHVFLLGATGFLGVHILYRLLNDTSCKQIYCLVRGESHSDANARMHDIFKWYFPNVTNSVLDKVKVFAGNISDVDFGLDQATIEVLQKKTSAIINAAANVSHVGDREKFANDNVNGVHNIIKFAGNSASKKIIHISTIGVKGLAPTSDKFTEMDLDVGQTMTEYYSESKLHAEIALNTYIREGGDAIIFRVGTIAPSSNGTFQRNIHSHFFSRFIKAILSLGVAPKWEDRYLSLTPVDCMAEMVLTIADRNNALSTFHINSDKQISYYELALWIKNMGYNLTILNHEAFSDHIDKIAMDKSLAPMLDGIIQLFDTSNIKQHKLSSELTDKILEDCNMSYPKITPEWFIKFIECGVGLEYFSLADEMVV